MNEQQLAELKSLKTTLRCLVVSNPAAMDTNNLRREYKLEMGKNIPFFEYGYRDIVAFLKERCSDVFTFSGMPSNPTLTPVITKEIMHIDKFIAKQKVPNTKFHKPKRSRTYETQLKTPRTNNSYSWEKAFANKKYNNQNTQITKEVQRQDKRNESHSRENEKNTPPSIKYKSPLKDQLQNASLSPNSWEKSKQKHDEYLALNYVPESKPPESEADSGTHTSSSGKSEKGHKLFVSNLKELISKHPKGIWSVELQSKYRDCFGVELDYERRGYNCLVSMCAELTEVFSVYRPDPLGDWLLLGSQAAPPLQEQRDIKLLCLQRQAMRAQEVHKEPETDEALPGIDFDPSMYPPDCLHFLESVPTLTLSKETQEDMLEVIVAEIADPSHFWFQLRGSEHSDAMEGIMDQMTDYYQSPEGAKRNMAAGAVRVGQYCAANFEGDWHRSVIVQILSKGMVKVRHIDYGTVESVCSEGLRYLPRVWAQLPAQALRGSLAKLAPAHAAARWPHSTARHFLHMVREKPLIAQILNIDPKEQIASMILVDTSSTEDIFINDELVAYGLAEPYFEEELSFDDVSFPLNCPSDSDAEPEPVPQKGKDIDSEVDLASIVTELSNFDHISKWLKNTEPIANGIHTNRDFDDFASCQSVVSESASQIIASGPQRMPNWVPDYEETSRNRSSGHGHDRPIVDKSAGGESRGVPKLDSAKADVPVLSGRSARIQMLAEQFKRTPLTTCEPPTNQIDNTSPNAAAKKSICSETSTRLDTMVYSRLAAYKKYAK